MSVKTPLKQMSTLAVLILLVLLMFYGFLALMAYIAPSSLPSGYFTLEHISTAGYTLSLADIFLNS